MKQPPADDNSSSTLPPLYATWMDELLEGPIPAETEATCEECVMCPKAGDRPAGLTFFDPSVKCCSYMPELPNFLVGRILADENPTLAVGKETIRKRIEAGLAVTPLGLGQPSTYRLLYRQSQNAFGRSRTLRCPHYVDENGGLCSIWRHRNSVCTTYFCKFVRGAVGREFWKTLLQLLSVVEEDLAQWCVTNLDLSNEALQTLIAPSGREEKTDIIDSSAIDGVVDRTKYRTLWGNWFGREEVFFSECVRLVEQLSWRDIMTVCRPQLRLIARLAREAYGRLVSHEPPKRLKVGSFNLVSLDQDSCCLSSYSALDPVVLPRVVIDLLHYFDARPTDEALVNIRNGQNIEFDTSLVRKLADFQILIPTDITTEQ